MEEQIFTIILRGIWKDNVPMTYGGDGHGGGTGSTTDECNFMFPGTSDDAFSGQEWTEVTAGNVPADRRFLQSAGAVYFTARCCKYNYYWCSLGSC